MSESPKHIPSKKPKAAVDIPSLPKPISKLKNWARELVFLGALGVAPVAGLAGCVATPTAPSGAASGATTIASVDSSISDWQDENMRLSLKLSKQGISLNEIAAIRTEIAMHHEKRPSKSFDLLDEHSKKITEITTCRGDIDATSTSAITLALLKDAPKDWHYDFRETTVASDAAAIASLQFVGNQLQVKAGSKLAENTYNIPVRLVPLNQGLKQKVADLTLNIETDVAPQPATFTTSDSAQKNSYVDNSGVIAAIGTNTILAAFTPQLHSKITLDPSTPLPQGVTFDELNREIVLTSNHTLGKGEKIEGKVKVTSDDTSLAPVYTPFRIDIVESTQPKTPTLDVKVGENPLRAALALAKGRTKDTIVGTLVDQADVAYVVSNVTSGIAGINSNTFVIRPNERIIVVPRSETAGVGSATLTIEADRNGLKSHQDIVVDILPEVAPIKVTTGKSKRFNIAPDGTLLARIKPQETGVTITHQLMLDGQALPENDLVVLTASPQGTTFNVAPGKTLRKDSTYHLLITVTNGKETERESVEIHINK